MANELVGRGWAFPLAISGGGGIALTHEIDDIEESIRIIIGTAPGERVMRPDFGCRIHELVFAPSITETLGAAVRFVEEALGWWEPRIDVMSIEAVVDPNDHARILVHVVYTVRQTKDERSLVYPFYLIEREAAG